ncbi:MAG: hypothetical protein JWR63_1875 [Conexibacter sp.]|nr:hypothetical protein [Conexibacter sp.]
MTFPPMPREPEDFREALQRRDHVLAQAQQAKEGQQEAARAERRAEWPAHRAELHRAQVAVRRAAEERGEPCVLLGVGELPLEAPDWWFDDLRVGQVVQAVQPDAIAAPPGFNALGQRVGQREPTPNEFFEQQAAAEDRMTLSERLGWSK